MTGKVKNQVSAEEWQQRINLAACYRLVAMSAQKNGVLPLSQQSIFVLSSLGYHDYEGVALRDDEKPRLVNDLGDNNFLMLRNHGLLTVADNVPDAFLFMYLFEASCMIQVRVQAAQVTRNAGGGLAWPGLLRKLDRVNPRYDD